MARAAGVARPSRLPGHRESGLSYPPPGPARPDAPTDARLGVFDGGYIGIAPVPGRRVNIGIVLGPAWRDRRWPGAARPPRPRRSLRQCPPSPTVRPPFRDGSPSIRSPGSRRWGPRDPPRRPGLGRWSAMPPGFWILSRARAFTGPSSPPSSPPRRSAPPLAERDRGRLRLRPRDASAGSARRTLVGRVVQAFLVRPPLFDYAARRLASRAGVRETMGLVMGDLAPAGRALDPRFLAALLRP